MVSTITYINNSLGYTLPAPSIQVVSVNSFPASGTFMLNSTTGLQTITYTSTNGSNTFLGCTGGTGFSSNGQAATFYAPAVTTTPDTTTFTSAGGITIDAVSTVGFPFSGLFTFNNNQLVQYSSITPTSFVGCYLAFTGGFGLGTYFPGTPVVASASTTVTDVSVSLPQSTINVVNATLFPTSGTVNIISSTGVQTITYTGTTPTSFTGCTGGTGTITTTSFVYYHASTITTSNNFSPISTLTVQTTVGFPTSGTLTFDDNLTMTYTGTTPTSFTGCSGENVFAPGTPIYYDPASSFGLTTPPLLHNDANSGQANSQGYNDLSGNTLLTDPNFLANTDYDPINLVHFKMRGYYVAGATYETFVVVGIPSNNPPSGHPLINVIIEAIF